MKNHQNIVQIHQQAAFSQQQIGIFHTKAHQLRSQAFKDIFSRIKSFMLGIAGQYRSYRQQQKALVELNSMNNRQLRDIGLTRGDLERLKYKAGAKALMQEREQRYFNKDQAARRESDYPGAERLLEAVSR